MERSLKRFDRALYLFLKNNVNIMPRRLSKIIADSYGDARIRKLYLKRVGVAMGEGTLSNLGLRVVPNDNKICVQIGDHVSIAPNVTFVCKSNPNNGKEIAQIDYVKSMLCKSGNIVVENEAWLGANVTILPGVTIGRCSVIGAGSVVSMDVEPYSVYAGVPARKIRCLITGERVDQKYD